MSICDVYLKNGFDVTDINACENFTIQISEPDEHTRLVAFCQTSRVCAQKTFASGCHGDLYNISASASGFPYGVTIYLDDEGVLAAHEDAIINNDSRKVFSVSRQLITSIINCINKSRDVIGKKKNQFLR